MYNGKTIENIQEACKEYAGLQDTKENYDLFSELRKNFIEPDLLNLLDDVDIITDIPGEFNQEEIVKILALPTGTVMNYIDISDDDDDSNDKFENTPPTRKVPSLHQNVVTKKNKDSFKTGVTKNSKADTAEKDETEDEFLKEFDPSGKFIAIAKSLIVNITDKVTFNDVAGLDNAKRAIRETVILPMMRPDIFVNLRSPARGILLFGPPGTGKTFLAKVAACECNSTFFSVSASSMTSKWIGDSEKLVRALFAVAKSQQPSIIFIDEIDSLLSARSEAENDNLRGLKTEFLVQLDGMSSCSTDQILVVAATNRPNALDEAARRRFTRRIYVGLPNAAAREQIIKLLLKKDIHSLNADDFKTIVSATNKFSCSDMKELVRSAASIGVRDIGSQITDPNFIAPPISMMDFNAAMNEVSKSVSDTDVDFHLNWNAQFGSFKEIDTVEADEASKDK